MYKIIGLGFDGCQASGITSPFDVFNVINTLWKQQCGEADLYQCRLVSVSGESITCSNGMRVMSDATLAEVTDADLIIIPGIHHYDVDTLLNKLKALDKECAWLKLQAEKGVTITANCSGVFVLAQTGMLNEYEATTAWWLTELFSKRYPSVKLRGDQLLVKSANTFTTGSMTANLGVMLQIVEQQVGRQLAQSCARTMLIDAGQNFASPYFFMQNQSDHQDSLILAVESRLQQEIALPLDVERLAGLHSVSVRTLSRRFKKANDMSISDYFQHLRLEYTKLLLETTSLSIEQVVERVGYSSQSSLLRLFKQRLGLSPSRYRKAYQQRTQV
ncbi:GlxA family transcriptional regulator [Neptunomonas japonica]|uniref:AraC family transcriptional regulator n=1 Tax=Neptunomonas japonica JAMM 1380 TaxID=1441457 RepID=A0A7R6SX79_9GAMM|nr:helix-turn-helix domain-containing protein [Neptunomonas japonica]BBB30407.1 AraC family transcriptional regulator [Neptunomonas japonica JAMM 1380]